MNRKITSLAILFLAIVYSINAQTGFGDPQNLSFPYSVSSDYWHDINYDGRADMLDVNDYDIRCWFNDGTNNFSSYEVLVSIDDYTIDQVLFTDLNDDGYDDIFIKWYTNLSYFLNDGNGNFGSEINFSSNNNIDFYYMHIPSYPRDIDGDNDKDLFLLTSDTDKYLIKIINDNNSGFSVQDSLFLGNASNIRIEDIDCDGDNDIIFSIGSDLICRSNDGNGNFGSSQMVSVNSTGLSFSELKDINSDGYIDIVFYNYSTYDIVWCANDGSGNFGTQQNICTQSESYIDFYDLDNDNDIDVLTRDIGANSTIYVNYNDGSGTFGQRQVISLVDFWIQDIVDFDADGDIDIIDYNSDHEYRWRENNPIPEIITQQQNVSVCEGIDTALKITGNASLQIFKWQLDNGSGFVNIQEQTPYSGTNTNRLVFTNPTTNLNNNIYRCIVYNFDNDSVISNEIDFTVNDLPIINTEDNILICPNFGTLTLTSDVTGGSGTYSYIWQSDNWSNNKYTENVDITEAGMYNLTVTDNHSCRSSIDIVVNTFDTYQNQQLCLVSVDPTTGKNKIIWEATQNFGIDKYLVQKAISSNVYSTIAIIEADEPTEYIDYGSDPMSHSDFYKITVMDTCGNQSDIDSSFYHKTINLTLSNVGSTMSLLWEQYEVEDGSYMPPLYYIYRGTTPDNLQLMDSVIGYVSSYNDLNVSQVYYYMIGTKRENCGSSKSINSTYEIFSNKKDNIDLISVPKLDVSNQINIYPNPAHNQITISNEQLIIESIEICDITGKSTGIVCHSEQSEESVTFNIANLENGVYLIKIKTTERNIVKRFVKE